MTESNIYVKFAPLNENTYWSLIDKEVWFSTIYDFDDFNEESLVGSIHIEGGDHISVQCPSAVSYLKKYLKDSKKFQNISDALFKSGSIVREQKKICRGGIFELSRNIDSEELMNKWYHVLVPTIAYLETGILCLADFEVFKDDSAQIMFGQYADNLKGLALIYEYIGNGNDIKKIDYESGLFNYTVRGDVEDLELLKGKDIKYFCRKSYKWNYQKEFRIFDKPGLKKAEDCGLKLRGILYSSRMPEHSLRRLQKINECFYGDELLIQEIGPGQDCISGEKCAGVFKVRMGGGDRNQVFDYVKEELK